MSKPRTANFSIPEDKYLANIFLDISQDPILSNNQSMQELWKRICDKYHAEEPNSQIQDSSQRSLQSQWSTMLKDTGKFNGCLRQVEYQNPSGASEQKILERANELLTQHRDYESRYKFTHMWPMLKEFVQAESVVGRSSFHEESTLKSPDP